MIGVIAAAVALAVCARADSPSYGFTDPPYDYGREYQDCPWPDDGSGRSYVPGYQWDRKAPVGSERGCGPQQLDTGLFQLARRHGTWALAKTSV